MKEIIQGQYNIVKCQTCNRKKAYLLYRETEKGRPWYAVYSSLDKKVIPCRSLDEAEYRFSRLANDLIFFY